VNKKYFLELTAYVFGFAGCKRSAIDQQVLDMERPSLTTGSGRLGDYGCDSPWTLIQSALKAMKEKHGDNIEFVLWSG
jgi:hypothetical protein